MSERFQAMRKAHDAYVTGEGDADDLASAVADYTDEVLTVGAEPSATCQWPLGGDLPGICGDEAAWRVEVPYNGPHMTCIDHLDPVLEVAADWMRHEGRPAVLHVKELGGTD